MKYSFLQVHTPQFWYAATPPFHATPWGWTPSAPSDLLNINALIDFCVDICAGLSLLWGIPRLVLVLAMVLLPCPSHCATHNKRIMLPLVECQKSLPLVCQLPLLLLLLSSVCLLFVCLFASLSPHSKKFQFNGGIT